MNDTLPKPSLWKPVGRVGIVRIRRVQVEKKRLGVRRTGRNPIDGAIDQLIATRAEDAVIVQQELERVEPTDRIRRFADTFALTTSAAVW